MKNKTASREIESLDYYLQNHTDDYSEESHTAMMMAIDALNAFDNLGDFVTKFAESYDYALVAKDVWRDAKKALETVEKIKRLTVTYAQTGNKPTRTISMEELKEFLE